MISSGEISNWYGYGVPGKHVNYATENRNTAAIVTFRLDITGNSLPFLLNWYITRVSGAGIDFAATSGMVALPYSTDKYNSNRYGRFSVAITNDTIDETGYQGELFTINVNTNSAAGIISHNFTLYDVDFAATITNSGDITNASGVNPSIYTFNVINNGTWAHSNAKWHDGTGKFLGTAAYGAGGTTSANNFAGSSLPDYGQYKTYKLSAHNGHSYIPVAESTIFREIPVGATLNGASSVTISSGHTSAVQFNFTNTSGTNVFRYYRVRRHSPSLHFGHLLVSSTMTMIIPAIYLPSAGGSFTYSLQMSDGRAYQTVGTPVTVTRGAAEDVVAGTSSGLVITNENTTGQTLNTSFNFSDTGAARFRVESDGDVQNHDNAYGSISDERIKQDIVDANSQWNDIKAVKVRNYKKKDDVRQYGDNAWSQIGVIAQELEAVSPKLIRHSDPNPSDILSSSAFGTLYADGDDIPEGKAIGDVKEVTAQVKSVNYSILYMKAIKALQEAMTKIETLETSNQALIVRIEALEDA